MDNVLQNEASLFPPDMVAPPSIYNKASNTTRLN